MRRQARARHASVMACSSEGDSAAASSSESGEAKTGCACADQWMLRSSKLSSCFYFAIYAAAAWVGFVLVVPQAVQSISLLFFSVLIISACFDWRAWRRTQKAILIIAQADRWSVVVGQPPVFRSSIGLSVLQISFLWISIRFGSDQKLTIWRDQLDEQGWRRLKSRVAILQKNGR